MRSLLVLAAACAVAAAQDIPRPEYPQPQFEREQWQSLNGKWEFEFDDAGQGLAQDWASGAKKFSRAIVVPYAFETAKSGIADPAFHPVIWYRRAFTVPADWKNRRVLLHFGAVFYQAQVWINGRAAGQHEGGNVPFAIDATPYLKAGPNAVTVRAENFPTDRFLPRGKQFWKVKSESIFYTRTSGIWQPVWLETAGESYLERVRITPSNDGAVKFEAAIGRPADGLEFSAAITAAGKQLASASSAANGSRATATATVADPELWSLEHPHLYDVTLELRQGGHVIDRVKSYFGFRTVRVEDGRVTLNGDPVYLKFVLDQGYWPESNLTPPTDDAIQYDIRMAKEMGFNGARKHQKLEDPRFLYWADKMGFLVSSEMANAYEFDDTYAQRFTREWQEAVERDYNHPSIIIWVPINESWGVPNLRDPKQVAHQRSLYLLTKALDDTRLVIDNDGWEHTDMTDLFAIHDYDARRPRAASQVQEGGARAACPELPSQLQTGPGPRLRL